MKSSFAPALVAVVTALGGCATSGGWYRPNTSADQYYPDAYQCQQAAASSYPVAMVQRMTSPGYQAPQSQSSQSNCTVIGNQVNCTSQQTGNSAAVFNRPPQYISEDANAENRSYAMRSCLLAKGYRWRQ